jgi:glycosyltransferase involved in cell wall biosynthesis
VSSDSTPDAGAAPRVSVIVPVWDDYVRRLVDVALPSLHAQGTALSVWVVNNASTEPLPPLDTPDVVIRVLRSPRRVTAGAVRNLGLAAVTDPWVVFWDADEAMPPTVLPGLLEHARRFPDAVAITGGIRHARTGRRYPFPPRWAAPLSRWPRAFALATTVRLIYPVVGALLRTETVRNSGGFADADAGEDWWLGVGLAVRGRVRFADVVVRDYAPRPGSLSHDGRSFRRVLERRRRLRELLRRDETVPRWLRRVLPLVALAHAVDVGAFRPGRSALKWLGARTTPRRGH